MERPNFSFHILPSQSVKRQNWCFLQVWLLVCNELSCFPVQGLKNGKDLKQSIHFTTWYIKSIEHGEIIIKTWFCTNIFKILMLNFVINIFNQPIHLRFFKRWWWKNKQKETKNLSFSDVLNNPEIWKLWS